MKRLIASLTALNILVALLCLIVGSSGVFGVDVFLRVVSGVAKESDISIFFGVRLPRLILAMIVGASLSASGCAMQALFRNPLAEPYVLGVASGASVGAAIVYVLGIATMSNILISAFVFALLTSFTVYKLGSLARFRDQNYAILLAGIAIATTLSGLTSLLIYFSAQSMHKVVFWIMGSLSNPRWEEVYFSLPIAFFGILFLLLNSWNFNALLLGEEHAMAVGLNVENFRRYLIGTVSLLTASAVAVSGVIGFVGIIVPHTMRLMVGEDYRKLLPATILFSTIFMPLVDLASRISTAGEIPVGALTALLGGPFFLYLLWRR